MKRLISLLLAALLVLGLCACAGDPDTAGTTGAADTTGSDDTSAGGFQAGYGRVNIFPEQESVPLSGYGNTAQRMSTGFISYIYADAIAIRDENGNTAIVIAVDAASVSTEHCANAAAEIEKKTGVPKENIFISANHLHSVPDINGAVPAAVEYGEQRIKGIVESAELALEDLAPAELYINKVEDTGLCFVRHYVNKNDEICGDNFGSAASGLKGHETEADDTLQLVKFVREGQTTAQGEAAKNIILANFQGHPHRDVTGANFYSIFANLPGVFRETLAKELDCHVAYFTGASGNVNQHSRITEENTTKDYKEQGEKLAKMALKAEDSYTKVDSGAVKVLNETKVYNTNQVGLDKLDVAQALVKEWLETDDTTAATQKAIANGFNSIYHCNAIIGRSNMDPKNPIDIGVLTIGDVAFVSAPYEMFDINGMFIKENSPFEMTVIMYLSNGWEGYMPAAQCCETGGYEVDTTYFEYGTAENLANDYLAMLNTLFAEY